MSIKIIKHKGGLYSLYAKQIVDKEIDFLWDFFSKPSNLNKLTPEDVEFKIISGKSDDFYAGKIISYKIKPFKLVTLNWITEISQVKEGSYFIDNQISGPYKMWHHEHHFKSNNDGTTEIIDKVKYKLPFYILGRISHKIFIKRKLIKIFNFRQKKINELFNNLLS
jgi:ligand-binding SRPBCC domain-containing protein|tara:strand:+ start:1006 stop:1503 length:498 start_codon:yes stop_codon:yes gene_type:complete